MVKRGEVSASCSFLCTWQSRGTLQLLTRQDLLKNDRFQAVVSAKQSVLSLMFH